MHYIIHKYRNTTQLESDSCLVSEYKMDLHYTKKFLKIRKKSMLIKGITIRKWYRFFWFGGLRLVCHPLWGKVYKKLQPKNKNKRRLVLKIQQSWIYSVPYTFQKYSSLLYFLGLSVCLSAFLFQLARRNKSVVSKAWILARWLVIIYYNSKHQGHLGKYDWAVPHLHFTQFFNITNKNWVWAGK